MTAGYNYLRSTPLKLIPGLALTLSLSVFAAQAAPIFRNPLPIRHSAWTPIGLVSADFNGDGHEDLLVADQQRGLNVLLANGTGPFAPAKVTAVPVTGPPTAGDVNGDGQRDVLFADGSMGTVHVLRGNGDGTFTASGSFAVPLSGPEKVVVADFNGDGLADVAVGSHIQVSVHLGNGAGQFGTGTVTGVMANSLHAADLNGDGRADLVASNGLIYENKILLSNGNGTFAKVPQPAPFAGNPAFADFNRDGKVDMALASGENVYVAHGNGQGVFSSAGEYGYVTGYESDSLDTADVDGDGNVDLLAAGNVVTVLRGKADGTFHAPAYYLSGSRSFGIAVADFDRDGAQDFVTIPSVTLPFEDHFGTVSFVRGNGDGTFAAYRSMHTRLASPRVYEYLATRPPVVADMNGDGRLDVVTIHEKRLSDNFAYSMSVLLGDGTGTLATPILSETAMDGNANNVPQFDLGDLNGDGWLDAVIFANGAWPLRSPVSLLGNGDGTFDPPVELPLTPPFGAPKLGHFDGDAVVDLLVTALFNVLMYRGNGDGTFAEGLSLPIGTVEPVRCGDLNGDGQLDFVASDGFGLAAYVNDGTGRFTKTAISTMISVPPALVADFNGDGKLDVLGIAGARTWTWLGNGDGTFTGSLSFIIDPMPSGAVTTADYDGDGKDDVSFGTSVYVSNGDGTFRSRARYRTVSHAAAAGDLDGSGSADLVFVDSLGDDVGVLLTRTYPDPVATPTLDLTASKATAQYAETVTFTATVAGGAVALTGVVVFSNGEDDVALVAVDRDGKATFSTAFPIGSYTITARYAGDEYYREASDSAGLAVTKAQPTIDLTSSGNPAPYGSSIRIYPWLSTSRSAGLAPPSGTITVRQGQTPIGSVPASTNGIPPFVAVTTNLPIGSHVFYADYPGDANYEAATGSFTQEIVKATPMVFLTITPPTGHIFPGQTVHLRAAVSTSATGTISFYASNNLLAAVALSGGVAETTTSFATWGSRPVKAVYSGNATLNPAETTQSVSVLIGPWGTPLQVVARAFAANRVTVQWSPLQDATSYKVWRRATLASGWTLHGTYSGGGMTFTVPSNTTEMFAVSALDGNGAESPLSAPDIATTVLFTDASIAPRVTRVKAQHFIDLRVAIGAVRTFAGLPAFSYTNAVAPGQRIRRADLTEMRTALAEARSAIGLPPVAVTDATPTSIRAVHVQELRTGVD